MEGNLVCPRCGCRTQHFSPARESYICDACGYALQSEADRRRQEQYARSIVQAKNHLQVGNWDSCSSLIRPLLNEHPTDSLLYLLLLASLTKGYEDYLTDADARRRAEAASVWDKLERLNSVNATMRRYASDSGRMRRDALNSRISTALLLAAGILIGFLVSCALTSGLAMALVVFLGFFAVRKIVRQLKPFSAMKELRQEDVSNPFK